MKNLLRSTFSFFDHSLEDSLSEDEFNSMNMMHIFMDQVIRDIDSQIDIETQMQLEAVKAAKKAAEEGNIYFTPRVAYSISGMKEIKEVCESIYRMSLHYITHTQNMIERRGKSFMGKQLLKSKSNDAIRKKFELQIIHPHEYAGVLSNKYPPDFILILNHIKHMFDSEKLFSKLAPVDPGFARKMQMLYVICSKIR
jgi:hypothetical protein